MGLEEIFSDLIGKEIERRNVPILSAEKANGFVNDLKEKIELLESNKSRINPLEKTF